MKYLALLWWTLRDPDWPLEGLVEIPEISNPSTSHGVAAWLVNWKGLWAPFSSFLVLGKYSWSQHFPKFLFEMGCHKTWWTVLVWCPMTRLPRGVLTLCLPCQLDQGILWKHHDILWECVLPYFGARSVCFIEFFFITNILADGLGRECWVDHIPFLQHLAAN